MNRQRLILFVLAIVFLIASFWSYKAAPKPKTVDKLTYPPGQQAKQAAAPARSTTQEKYDGRILNLALLEQIRADFTGYRRNIFKPIFIDEHKMLKQKAAAFKQPQLPPVQSQKDASVVVPPAAQPEAAVALGRFIFLGFLKKDARKTIFLAKDKDIFLVKKGEKVSGRYEASSITEQALTLIDNQTGDEIVVPLIENKPLATAAPEKKSTDKDVAK